MCVEFTPPQPFHVRANLHGFREIEYADTWSICLLGKEAEDGVPQGYEVPSIFRTKADLMQANSALRGKFYDFHNANN